MFDGEPELACEWLMKRVAEEPDQLWRDDYNIGLAMAGLTPGHRRHVIDCLQENYIADEFIQGLIGDDIEAYRHLLSIPQLARVHLDPLRGRPKAGWSERALAALDAGHTPDELVHAISFQGPSLSRSEAESWQAWIDSLHRSSLTRTSV